MHGAGRSLAGGIGLQLPGAPPPLDRGARRIGGRRPLWTNSRQVRYRHCRPSGNCVDESRPWWRSRDRIVRRRSDSVCEVFLRLRNAMPPPQIVKQSSRSMSRSGEDTAEPWTPARRCLAASRWWNGSRIGRDLTSALDYLAKDATPVTLRLDSKCPRARRDRRSLDRARFQRLSVIFELLCSFDLGDIYLRSSLLQKLKPYASGAKGKWRGRRRVQHPCHSHCCELQPRSHTMWYDRPSRRSLGHTTQGRPYIGTGRQKLVRSAGRRRNAVLGFERLEDRTSPATLIDGARAPCRSPLAASEAWPSCPTSPPTRSPRT